MAKAVVDSVANNGNDFNDDGCIVPYDGTVDDDTEFNVDDRSERCPGLVPDKRLDLFDAFKSSDE